MSFPQYLRLLRPVRTLLMSVIYANICFSYAGTLLRFPRDLTVFASLILISPAITGVFVLAPVHELLHSRFSMTLPGVREQLLRFHLLTLGLLTLLYAGLAAWLLPDLPLAASLGWSAAGLSLPLFNRRKVAKNGIRHWYLWLILFGFALVSFGTGACHAFSLRHPWLVLAAATAVPVLGARVCFDRSLHRERITAPVSCLQSALSFSQKVIARSWLAAQQRKPLPATKPSSEASITPNDGSTRAWLRTLTIARMGLSRHALLRLILIPMISALVLFAAIFYISRIIEGEQSFANFLAYYGEGLSSPLRSGRPPIQSFFTYLGFPSFIVILVTTQSLYTAQIPFPVSRHRLARLNFLFTLRAIGLVYFGLFLSVLLGFVIARFAFGQQVSLGFHSHFLRMMFQALPFIPLCACSLHLRNRLLALFAFTLSIVFTMVTLVAIGLEAIQPLASGLGLLGSLLFTAATFTLFWFVQRRRFLRQDLVPSLLIPLQ